MVEAELLMIFFNVETIPSDAHVDSTADAISLTRDPAKNSHFRLQSHFESHHSAGSFPKLLLYSQATLCLASPATWEEDLPHSSGL